MYKYDCVIIGAGLAGLRAAITLANAKMNVAVLCKTYPNQSHSVQAAGGINAAISIHDSPAGHAYDTVYGSDFLADQDSVELLVRSAPKVISELEEFGVNFTKNRAGKILQRKFGAQSFDRTCFVADRTGQALMHSVYVRAVESGVNFYNETYAVSLATSGTAIGKNRVFGVVAYDNASGEVIFFSAGIVILATGGAGRIYAKTTNPENTADGIGMAYLAGAELKDMEMMQFHPTTLPGTNKLLSEAARGEGAYLLNSKGERFMKKYAPAKMELASRDVVTRAELAEIVAGRGVNGIGNLNDSVLLDFRHISRNIITERIPDAYRNALEIAGVDITKEPLPIQPAQHYTMGGIATDNDCKTNIAGLFAVGECACVSVHGANRLGGNSLLETLVFGKRASVSVLMYLKNNKTNKNDKSNQDDKIMNAMNKANVLIKTWLRNGDGNRNGNRRADLENRNRKTSITPREAILRLGQIMDTGAGPLRDVSKLGVALGDLHKLGGLALNVEETGRQFNAELRSAFEFSAMLPVARCVVASALIRKESRGAHFRTDFPERNDSLWLKHVICKGVNAGTDEINISYSPVRFGKYLPEKRSY